MAEPTSCCVLAGSYCARVDTLFNMPGVHVLEVTWRERSGRTPAGLRLLVETDRAETGCPDCGVVATGHGRRLRRLHDIPVFGAPVELLWRQRRYRCLEWACPVGGFSEDHLLGGCAPAGLAKMEEPRCMSQPDPRGHKLTSNRPGKARLSAP